MASLKPYKKYIPVEYDYVAAIPDGWKLLPNIAIFEERIERDKGDFELLSISISKGVVRQADMDKKDISSPDKSNYKIVRVGDIAYGMEFRKGAVGFSMYEGIVSPVYTVLKPRKKNLINSKFFHYVLRTEYYKNYIWRNVYGIGEHFLPCRFTHFKRMYSILPPLETQNTIVEYLDKKNLEIEKFIRNKERLIELLKIKKDTINTKLVTRGTDLNVPLKNPRIDWIQKIPKHWEMKPFKIVFSENKGKNDFKEEYPVLSLSYGNVILKDLDSNFGLVPQNYDSYQIIKPDTLVFRFTDLQNDHKSLRVGLARNKGIITSAYLAIIKQPNIKLSMDYAYLLLHSYDIEKVFYQFGGGVRQAIGFPDVKQLPILIPPLKEQIDIVNEQKLQSNKINSTISKAQKEIAAIQEYREALITDLVIGKRCVP